MNDGNNKMGQLSLQWNLNSVSTDDAWRIISIVTRLTKEPDLVKKIYDIIHVNDAVEEMHSGNGINVELLSKICQSPKRTMRMLTNEEIFTDEDLKDFILQMMPGDRPAGYGLTVVSDILAYAFIQHLVDAPDDKHIVNIVKRFFNEGTSDCNWVCGRVKVLTTLFAKGDETDDTK